jgi:hypothetical protein
LPRGGRSPASRRSWCSSAISAISSSGSSVCRRPPLDALRLLIRVRRLPGSPARGPLGVTIVGGLVVSQLMNLFSTPVIFLYLDRLRRRERRDRQTSRGRAANG